VTSRPPTSEAPSPRPTVAEATTAPSGEATFSYDTTRVAEVVERKREQRGTVTILDLQWVGDWGDTMRAYLVLPAGVGPSPAVVYLHWLSSDASASREEFLDEGIDLAGKGVASLHIQGRFPWVNSPKGAELDRAGIIGQVVDFRRAVDYLASRPEVDPSGLAIVGHDFGAMYAAVLAGVDVRFDAAVIVAGAPHWADWFVRYWRPLGTMSEADYRAQLADLDPTTLVAKVAPRPILFQWGSQDSYVEAALRDEFVVAAGKSVTSKIYEAPHKLDDAGALSDREAWLIKQLKPAGS
jgi:dienelactone hydrolase